MDDPYDSILGYLCACYHTIEEHRDHGFFRPCLVEGCDCLDYDGYDPEME